MAIIKRHPEAKIWRIDAHKGSEITKLYKRDIPNNEGVLVTVGSKELERFLQESPINHELVRLTDEVEYFIDKKSLFTLSNRELADLIYSKRDDCDDWFDQFNFN